MRRSTTRGRDGDYLVIDDRTGFTRWRSECQKEWNGLFVHHSVWEARHPQDFLRARREDFRVPDARPQRRIEDEPFSGPLFAEIGASIIVPDEGRHAPMGALGEFALGDPQTDGAATLVYSNAAGSFYLSVDSVSRMSIADRIGVYLDNGDLFRTTISALVPGVPMLQVADALTGSVSAGNRVIDYTVISG